MNSLSKLVCLSTLSLYMLTGCGGDDGTGQNEQQRAQDSIDSFVDTEERVVVNQGGAKYGSNVGLPDGFAKDVKIPDGVNIMGAAAVPGVGGHSLQLMSKDSTEEFAEKAATAMESEGWTLTKSAAPSPMMMQLGFEKDDRMTTMAIMDNNGRATVQLVTMPKP